MNILVLNWRDIKHPEAGGAEVHLHELFGRIVKRGHRVVLLTTRFKGCSPVEELDGMTVLRRGSTWFFNWQVLLLVPRIRRDFQIDCIIDDVNKIPFFSPLWFPRLPCGVIFHHLFGKTIYDLALAPMAAYVLFLENRSGWFYHNTPCCTVSKSTATELVNAGFHQSNITIIENSVDTGLYTPLESVLREPEMLLYTGRLKRYKNVEALIEATARIAATGRFIKLAIAGSGDDESRLRSLVTTLNLNGNVTFYGHVSEAQKIDLYRKATIFVNPSRKEGWGITAIEANACGAAVVANDAPGLRDSVQHNRSGLLYRENDVDDMVRCILLLLDNPSTRARLIEQGRLWALNFSWDASAVRLETWIRHTVLHQP